MVRERESAAAACMRGGIARSRDAPLFCLRLYIAAQPHSESSMSVIRKFKEDLSFKLEKYSGTYMQY